MLNSEIIQQAIDYLKTLNSHEEFRLREFFQHVKGTPLLQSNEESYWNNVGHQNQPWYLRNHNADYNGWYQLFAQFKFMNTTQILKRINRVIEQDIKQDQPFHESYQKLGQLVASAKRIHNDPRKYGQDDYDMLYHGIDMYTYRLITNQDMLDTFNHIEELLHFDD